MSDYKKQLQAIIKDYQRSSQKWPASTADIARWALRNKKYDLRSPTIEKIVRKDLAQAMREEYITDSKGRRVRAKHPAKIKRDGEQITIWDDIRTAPRVHMEMAFSNRRNHIVAECRQVKTDVDSYNDANPKAIPIQMILDFTRDVEELEGVEIMNEEGEWNDVEELETIS